MKNNNARRGAPLVEIICAVCIFAVCSAIIIQLFVGARFAANCATDTNNAIFIGESFIENLKNSPDLTATVMQDGFTQKDNTFIKYFDKNWQNSVTGNGVFEMRLDLNPQTSGVEEGVLEIRKLTPYPFVDKAHQLLCSLEYAKYIGGGDIA